MGALEPELETDQVIQIIEESRNSYRKLIVRDQHLVGAMLVGNTAATAALVQIFDRDDPMPEDPLEVLCQVRGPGSVDRQICNCHKVSERALREAIESGADSIASLGERTKAGTGCGSCKADLGQLIATLKKPAPALEAAS
jgi:nitrite reductase (NADH) large subunit